MANGNIAEVAYFQSAVVVSCLNLADHQKSNKTMFPL